MLLYISTPTLRLCEYRPRVRHCDKEIHFVETNKCSFVLVCEYPGTIRFLFICTSLHLKPGNCNMIPYVESHFKDKLNITLFKGMTRQKNLYA